MIRLSSALRAALATDYGVARMLQLGHIRVFSGEQPASADDADQGEHLASITQDGNDVYPGLTAGGLVLVPGPVAGACQNSGNWVLKVHRSGVAGWWRFYWNSYDGGRATDYTPRVDGTIGEGLVLPQPMLTANQSEPIDSFFFFIPPT
ncbi:MAG: hypothetical protein Q4G70_01365 [Pseudomonadota bacterium]|nr:hypothetical protein [Pseudomonadota bacterium]